MIFQTNLFREVFLLFFSPVSGSSLPTALGDFPCCSSRAPPLCTNLKDWLSILAHIFPPRPSEYTFCATSEVHFFAWPVPRPPPPQMRPFTATISVSCKPRLSQRSSMVVLRVYRALPSALCVPYAAGNCAGDYSDWSPLFWWSGNSLFIECRLLEAPNKV